MSLLTEQRSANRAKAITLALIKRQSHARLRQVE